MSGKNRKNLTGEDRDLWDQVKRSAKPLKASPMPQAFEADAIEASASAKKPKTSGGSKKPVLQEQKPVAKAPPPLVTLDRRARSRVARGQVEIGARLDLHGMTLERARRRLEKFLYDAQDDGVGLALVITGKGRGKSSDGYGEETGALRREVPMWLSQPSLRAIVIGLEEAARSHGGSGALYVRIRRARN